MLADTFVLAVSTIVRISWCLLGLGAGLWVILKLSVIGLRRVDRALLARLQVPQGRPPADVIDLATWRRNSRIFDDGAFMLPERGKTRPSESERDPNMSPP